MNVRRTFGGAVMVIGLAAVAIGATEGLRIVRDDDGAGQVAAVDAGAEDASDGPTSTTDGESPTESPAVESPAPVHIDGGTRRFVDTFVGWLRASDGEALLAALHPAVIARYGEATCRNYTNGLAVDERFTIEVDTVTSVPRWDYATDGLSLTLTDVVRVNGRRILDGETSPDEFHFAQLEGAFRWFTDCGTPG